MTNYVKQLNSLLSFNHDVIAVAAVRSRVLNVFYYEFLYDNIYQ